MKRSFLQIGSLCLIGLTILSCKKKSEEPQPEEQKSKYVIASANAKWGAGQFTAYNGMPSGNVSNVNGKSLQMTNIFGVTSHNGYLFNRSDAAGTAGLQRYTVSDDLSIKDAGFISGAANFVVVDEQTGFYSDETRNPLKIQKFNPSTMQRTGDIDLTSLKDDSVEYQAIGKHILAAKEGKLYAFISYGTAKAKGYGDDVYNEVEFAVIDIATGNLDKTIKFPGIKGMGWGSSANNFWTLGDDGALYFFNMGFSMGMSNSSIIRIKKGETNFDATFHINADDYQKSSAIATVLVKGGKLYTQFSKTELKADYSNLGDFIFDYYVIDLTTKQRTKITGMPTNHFAHANEQAIVEIDGKIYFWVQGADKEQAYYVLGDNNTASRVFNVTDGGFSWGFVKVR